MNASDPPVVVCPARLRAAALRALHDGLPLDERPALVEALHSTSDGDEGAWDGLLIAVRTEGDRPAQVIGAAWVQRSAGNTAVVWPPAATCPAADGLLRAAARWCDQHDVALAQLSAAVDDAAAAERFAACGFTWLADLIYMYADAVATAAVNPAVGSLTLVARAGDQPQRLATLVERTYCNTLDCPGLDRARETAEVLTGYRAQGRYIPEHWYFVQRNGVDVGVLILAEHTAASNCELVYMGVAPESRGIGLGEQIVRHAIAISERLGAQRLVLAVDAGNVPAVAMYQRAGLVPWERRTVFARRRGTRSTPRVTEF